MGDALADLFGSMIGILGGLLPQDPFAQYLVVVDSMRLGVGYLNWLFPVGDAAAFMALWVASTVAAVAAKKVIGGSLNITGLLGRVLGS